MRTLTSWGRIAIFAFLATAILGTGNPLAAQTTEGTVITNIATAAYTDANGNTYTDATGQVSVTVGFSASLTVTAGAATVNPGAGSTGNQMTFDILNPGNGTDSVSVNVTNSNTSGATITGYIFNSVTYADLTTLNQALAAEPIDPLGAETVTITVVYDVPAGATPSDAADITLTATSRRDGAQTNNDTTTVTPGGVVVTATAATTSELPSGTGPASYTVTYTVQNNSSVSNDLDLSASLDATNNGDVTITGIDAGGAVFPGTDSTVTFTANETKTVTITYQIGVNGAKDDQTTITLTATASAVAGTPSDNDNTVLTVLRPSLTITKTVHGSLADANSDTPLAGNPLPGDQIFYKVVVDNSTGTAAATVTSMTDDISALPLTFVPASIDETGSATAWTSLGEAAGVVTGTVTIAAGGTASFIFAVTIN